MSPIDPSLNDGDSLVSALSSSDIIDSKKVTFWLNLSPKNSTVTFGSNIPDNIRHHQTVSLNLEKKYKNWWTVSLHKINYGTTNIKGSDTNYAILDTGTSLIAIAKTDYNNFVEELMTQVDTADCNSANGC